MVCEHLAELEKELLSKGVVENYRGRTWSKDCREWVYFNVRLDTEALQARFSFAPCVKMHENLDSKSGLERGLECTTCHDAIIGLMEGGELYR